MNINRVNDTIYPDLPAIAVYYKIDVEAIEDYQVWYSCFFVRIAKIGWRFVSRAFARTKVMVKKAAKKVALKVKRKVERVVYTPTQKKQQEWQNSLYRVIRTWDNGSSWYGDRVESVLMQNVNNKEKPEWDSVFLKQNIKRNDILARGAGGRLVKFGV